VEHVSDWHVFNPGDRETYPNVEAPLQVRFENGRIEDGMTSEFFPRIGLLPVSSMVAWRNIDETVVS
jgi:hypothetical protein